MSTEIKVDFRLQGEVNGKVFEMNGEGTGNPEDGTCILHLEASPEFPEGFDPVSCPYICGHPTSLFFARSAVPGIAFSSLTDSCYEVTPGRTGLIHNSKGQELLNLKVNGSVEMKNGRLLSVQKMRGISKLPTLESSQPCPEDYIVPSREGEATAMVRFKLLARNGEELDGMTIVPYQWKNGHKLQFPLVRQTESIKVDWDGKRSVTAYYRTVIRPLYTSMTSDLVENLEKSVAFV